MSKRLLLQAANVGWQMAGPMGRNLSYGEQMNVEDRTGSPHKTGVAHETDAPHMTDAPHKSPALGDVIRGRIHKRIGDRVHELDIAVDDVSVVLRGRCATFYTKQLAQHAALGVLDNEQLVNQIVVTSN